MYLTLEINLFFQFIFLFNIFYLLLLLIFNFLLENFILLSQTFMRKVKVLNRN